MKKKRKSIWRAIKTYRGEDEWMPQVDLWLSWGASPLTMGIQDSFRVVDCWRREGKWYHRFEGKEAELRTEYVTHWAPRPVGPNGERRY
jgi:hypothetical protein